MSSHLQTDVSTPSNVSTIYAPWDADTEVKQLDWVRTQRKVPKSETNAYFLHNEDGKVIGWRCNLCHGVKMNLMPKIPPTEQTLAVHDATNTHLNRVAKRHDVDRRTLGPDHLRLKLDATLKEADISIDNMDFPLSQSAGSPESSPSKQRMYRSPSPIAFRHFYGPEDSDVASLLYSDVSSDDHPYFSSLYYEPKGGNPADESDSESNRLFRGVTPLTEAPSSPPMPPSDLNPDPIRDHEQYNLDIDPSQPIGPLTPLIPLKEKGRASSVVPGYEDMLRRNLRL